MDSPRPVRSRMGEITSVYTPPRASTSHWKGNFECLVLKYLIFLLPRASLCAEGDFVSVAARSLQLKFWISAIYGRFALFFNSRQDCHSNLEETSVLFAIHYHCIDHFIGLCDVDEPDLQGLKVRDVTIYEDLILLNFRVSFSVD